MTREPDDLDTAIEALPPASEMHGDTGHDTALIESRAAALMRDKALGFTYDEIAQRHGYSDRASARNALIRALRARAAENAADLRAIENERYEMDQRRLRLIIDGEGTDPALRIRAIDTRTRSAHANARLNGTLAPVQVQISAGVREQLQAAFGELEEVVSQIVAGQVIGEPYDEPLEA